MGLLYLREIIKFIGYPLRALWNMRYWFTPTVRFANLPEMNTGGISAYTPKPFYKTGEPIDVCVNAPEGATFTLYKITAPYTYEKVLEREVESVQQEIPQTASTTGCNWPVTFQLKESLTPGYYKGAFQNGAEAFYMTFVVGASEDNKVAIIVPFSTWTAYNPWGGKSLYKNGLDKQHVYSVAAQRPNTSLQYSAEKENINDVNVEANIYNWMNEEFGASLFPDYYLEAHPEVFKSFDVLVLSYHCEYVSQEMYSNLRRLVKEGKSLISLGGNQVFWKIRWKNDYTEMECHKNLTFFKNSFWFGGGWRHSFYPEDALLGVRYSESGDGTFAPYRVENAEHWLFEDTEVKKGDLFGSSGINSKAICGDETDETTFFSRPSVDILARGINKKAQGDFENYDGSPAWNGQGGGEMTFKELSKNHAVLATGSIYSGSGLGTDPVFSKVIKNFIERYIQ